MANQRVRRFTHTKGFGDSTDYVEYVGSEGTLVKKNGNRVPYPEPISFALRAVVRGSWVEVPVPLSPGAWVKIPGLQPTEPNALRRMSAEDLDKLQVRIDAARKKIEEQAQDALLTLLTKPGTTVRMKAAPRALYLVVDPTSPKTDRVSLVRLTSYMGPAGSHAFESREYFARNYELVSEPAA